MGKKSGGGGAPAIDPSVGQAQLKMANLAESQWTDWQNNIFPWLKAENDKANKFAEEERDYNRGIQAKQDKIADEYYDRMKSVYYPAQNKLMAEAMNYNTGANRERLAGEAQADLADAYNKQRAQSMIRLGSMGINPNSGQGLAMNHADDIMQVANEGAAATRARRGAEQLGWAKMMDAIGMGQGLAGNQATSTSIGLQAGNSALGASQMGLQNAMGMGNMQMGAYGQNAGMWGNVGNLGMQKSNYNMQGWQAQQQQKAQSSAGWGKLVGGIAGSFFGPMGSTLGSAAGDALLKMSDERTKKNAKHVGFTPHGAKVYEYEYKKAFQPFAGEGKHLGVMAQEIEETQPEAVVQVGGLKVVDYSKVK